MKGPCSRPLHTAHPRGLPLGIRACPLTCTRGHASPLHTSTWGPSVAAAASASSRGNGGRPPHIVVLEEQRSRSAKHVDKQLRLVESLDEPTADNLILLARAANRDRFSLTAGKLQKLQTVMLDGIRAQAQPGISSSLLPINIADLLEASAILSKLHSDHYPDKAEAEDNKAALLGETEHLLAEAGNAVFRGAKVPVLLQALLAMDLLGLTHSMGRASRSCRAL